MGADAEVINLPIFPWVEEEKVCEGAIAKKTIHFN